MYSHGHEQTMYREISLLNTAYKIYSKIIVNRLKDIIYCILIDEQTAKRACPVQIMSSF